MLRPLLLQKAMCRLSAAAAAVARRPLHISFPRQVHNRQANYYEVLGVDKNADPHTIKMAYFKMARDFHPDKNKNVDARQMFELIAEAYDVLSDAKMKAQYDETGEAFQHFGGRAQGPQRQTADSNYTPEQMYARIFSTPLSHEPGEDDVPDQDFSRTNSGVDISREFVVNLSFEEAITGTMVTLWIRVAGICNKCEGSRSELGYTGKSCPYCEGTGYETIRTGHIVSRRDCSYCKGTKIFYKYKCIECAGKGRILYSRPFYIDIPPGVEHGQLLKFPVSHEILDIPPDEKERERILYVTLNVKDSNFFRREGMDLHSHIRLSPALALLGGSIEYEGLTVNCDLPIDCCTSSHTTLVVNQAGVHSENYRGDHLLTTVLKVPKKLTWRQRRAFLRFAALENLNSSGTIAGVEGELDHRFSVNVQVPDKTCNPCLAGALHNQEKPDLYKRLRTKFLELHDKYPILNRLYD